MCQPYPQPHSLHLERVDPGVDRQGLLLAAHGAELVRQQELYVGGGGPDPLPGQTGGQLGLLTQHGLLHCRDERLQGVRVEGHARLELAALVVVQDHHH